MNSSDYYNRANSKVENKDFNGAINDFTEAIKMKPDFADAYIYRGMAKKNLKDFEGAINDFNLVTEFSSNHAPVAYALIGIVHSELGDYGKAIAYFSLAIKISTHHVDWIYYQRGIAKIRDSLIEEGCVDLQIAAKSGYAKAIEALKKYRL